MKTLTSLAIAALFAASTAGIGSADTKLSAAAAPTEQSLPDESIYQLSSQFEDQAGHSFRLSERQGKVQLVALFYTSCKYICPLIVDSARGVDRSLTPKELARLQVLMVSIDPKRDTPQVLNALSVKRQLDLSRWTLARTDAKGVRMLAALLGVRFRALDDGEFNHTSQLTLLDEEGRIIARTEKMTPVPDPEFLAKVRSALQSR